MSKNVEIDCVLELDDFYIIHTALRSLASNLDFVRSNVFEIEDEAFDAESTVRELADKIEYYMEKVKNEGKGFN